MSDDTGQSITPQDTPSVSTPSDTPLANPVDSTWPDSTNLANLSAEADSLAKVDGQPTTPVSPPSVSVEEKPPEPSAVLEPPKEETPSQAISSEVGQVADNPIPPLSAEALAKVDNLANDQPESTSSSNLANPPDLPNDTSTIQLQSPLPEEKPPEQPILSETPPPQVGQSEPSEATFASDLGTASDLGNPSPINVNPPTNQVPQVQSEAPNDASHIDTEKTPDQLANFKPESPEQPQEAPLADLSVETLVKEDNDSSKSIPTSFGDLLSGNTSQPASSPSASPSPDLSNASDPTDLPVSSSSNPQPITQNPQPSSSFGDLIKDIEITPPPISPPPVNPQPTTNNPQPVSQSPPTTSSVIDQNEMQKQFEEKSKAKLVENRIKANQARSQKKENHLNKIMELVKNTKTITNTHIQRLLRVSQSTATNYLSELTRNGMLKREGIRGGAKYTL